MTDLPPTWIRAQLGHIGTWVGGGTPSKQNLKFWTNGTIPWVSPKDMKCPQIVDTEDRITRAAIANSATNLVPEGSVLVVTRSGILEHSLPVAVAAREVTINQDLKALIPNAGIAGEYVAAALRAFSRTILSTCTKHGTTVQSVEFPRLKAFEIPIAPTAEQSRIVSKLDALFSDLDAAEASLSKAKELLARYRQSVLKAAVTGALTGDPRSPNQTEEGIRHASTSTHSDWAVQNLLEVGPALPPSWRWVSVGDLCSKMQYGTSAKCHEKPQGIPVLRMGNIVDGELTTASLKYLPKNHSEFPDLLLQPGDLLFNRTNSAELVGKTAVYRGVPDLCSFASYLIRFRVVGLEPDFVAAYINSVYGKSWIRSVVSQQVGQANVNGSKLRALRIPCPPPDEQIQIVQRLRQLKEQMSEFLAIIDEQLSLCSTLRQSILSQAFSGHIVDQQPRDVPASTLLQQLGAKHSLSHKAEPNLKSQRLQIKRARA